MNRCHLGAALAVALTFAACGSSDGDDTAVAAETTTTAAAASGGSDSAGDEQQFPDVLGATFEETDDRVYTVSVTLSSPYDTAARYADAWRVVTEDGTELGIRVLTHDHANEQPFTRSQSGIEIPGGIDRVVIEGRDQQYGWGGTSLTIAVP